MNLVQPKGRYLCIFAAIILIGLSTQAMGQSTYGVILGTVTDASGSVIPNAEIQARNQDRDVTLTTHTDSTGDCRFVNMDPGSYTITVSAQNFRAVKNEGVVLPARGIPAEEARLRLGQIASLGVLAYALGKFFLGGLADFWGGKREFLAAMGGAFLFTVIAAAGGLAVLAEMSSCPCLTWFRRRRTRKTGWIFCSVSDVLLQANTPHRISVITCRACYA